MSLQRRETILMVAVMVVVVLVEVVWCHGMMMEPTQRSSMWRFPKRFPNAFANYNDNELFCGGFTRQHDQNGGKCGVCGDPYDEANPPNEAGGNYAQGVIVETYGQGEVIDVTVKITANHLGYFIFKLCPNNNITKRVNQSCMDQHVLQAMGTNDEDLRERYYIGSTVGAVHVRLQLPSDVTCTQCVLQWTYIAGNNWGREQGKGCLGCGSQETFVNCADIAINASDHVSPDTRTSTTPESLTTTPSSSMIESLMERQLMTETSTPTPTTTTTTAPATASSSSQMGGGCVPTSIYMRVPGMSSWCDTNCAAGYCPASHCKCF